MAVAPAATPACKRRRPGGEVGGWGGFRARPASAYHMYLTGGGLCGEGALSQGLSQVPAASSLRPIFPARRARQLERSRVPIRPDQCPRDTSRQTCKTNHGSSGAVAGSAGIPLGLSSEPDDRPARGTGHWPCRREAIAGMTCAANRRAVRRTARRRAKLGVSDSTSLTPRLRKVSALMTARMTAGPRANCGYRTGRRAAHLRIRPRQAFGAEPRPAGP